MVGEGTEPVPKSLTNSMLPQQHFVNKRPRTTSRQRHQSPHHPPPIIHHPPPIIHYPHYPSFIIHHSQSPKSIMDQLEAERKAIQILLHNPQCCTYFCSLAYIWHSCRITSLPSRIEKPAPLQTRLGFENNPHAYRNFRVHYPSFKLTVGLVASSYDWWGCQLWT